MNPYMLFCQKYRGTQEWSRTGAGLSVPEQGKLLGQVYGKMKKCEQQTTAKYTNRPGPPYPANECPRDMEVSGNDGKTYKIRTDVKGIQRWVLKDTGKAAKATAKAAKAAGKAAKAAGKAAKAAGYQRRSQ